MDLELSEEQLLLQKSVREFAEAEVRPLAKENDETGKYPRGLFQKAAELGLTGVAIPEAEGGAGMDHISYAIVVEEIAFAFKTPRPALHQDALEAAELVAAELREIVEIEMRVTGDE